MDQTSGISGSNDVLRKRSLVDEVYDFLFRKIIAGKYTPGDWLRQEDISTQLGVSQTPVREALDRLVASGLAERVAYRGVRVPSLENKEIVDAFIMRLILENLAARLSAERILPEEIQSLDDIVEKTRNLLTLEDMSTLRQLNKEFHMRLVEAADSSLLYKLYEMATNSFPDWMLYEYLFRHPEHMQSSLKREYHEHKAIVDALKNHDTELISQHVINHIKNLADELETYLNIPSQLIDQLEQQIEPMLSIHQK